MDPSDSTESSKTPFPNLLTAPPLPLAPPGSSPTHPSAAQPTYSDPQPTAPLPDLGSAPSQRLLCLDAFRGLIMIMLVFDGFGLAKAGANIIQLANKAGDSEIATRWESIRYQFSVSVFARRVGGLFVLGYDPAFVYVHGGCVDGVFLRKSTGAWAFLYATDGPPGHGSTSKTEKSTPTQSVKARW